MKSRQGSPLGTPDCAESRRVVGRGLRDRHWPTATGREFDQPVGRTIAVDSADEERFICLGRSYAGRLLVVAYVERGVLI